MLHKYRYLILNILIASVIVILCLFAPELLLTMEKNNDTGQVQQGVNQYYADDVSDDSISGFNFKKRLMMLSGQWVCEKEVVMPTDDLLSEKDFRKLSVSIPAMLMSILDKSDVLDGFLWDFISDKLIIAAENSPWETEIMETELPENFDGYETTAFSGPDVYRDANVEYAALYANGTAVLYKYTDSILDGNDFFVWEKKTEKQ